MTNNENQDVALENNEEEAKDEAQVEEESSDKEDASEEKSDREKELEGDNAKLRRQLKRASKKSDEPKSKAETKESDKEFGLLQKTYLRSADIKDEDEVELARKLQEETGKELDVLIESKYFKSELEELRDAKATTKATSGVKGGGGESKAVNTPEYWISKGVPPTPEQVPDRKVRVKIARAMMKNASTSGKTFYNE